MRVSSLLEFPPRKPKTGWRVWRMISSMDWHVELYIDGKNIVNETCNSIYDVRFGMHAREENLSPEDLKHLRIAELFNEACE